MHPSDVLASFLRSAADLVAALATQHVLLRRFDYDPAFFGTFQFEFSKGHQRARATWDARERVLTLETARVQNDSQRVNWQVVEESRREDSESALTDLHAQVLNLLP